MDAGNRIEIIDKEGWRKEFFLDKRLIFVGSDVRNDIVLSPARGTGVLPRHLQLIAIPRANGMINAVNLSTSSIPLGDGTGRILDPNSAIEVVDGESFHLGEFTLTFHLADISRQAASIFPDLREPVSPATGAGTSSIGMRISLPTPIISPDKPVEGIIYVSNIGNAPGVQFKLSLDGLSSDFYEIGPAPILFPGAEKGISFRLYHPCLPEYLAGAHRLVFKAEAPEAYPGECAVENREVRILPYYSHTLRLLSAD